VSLFDLPAGAAPPPPRPRRKQKPRLEDLPQHVLAKLEDLGAIQIQAPGRIATRRARMTFCTTCGHTVMRGLLPMPTPWAVDLDPAALTPVGEALALLAGRTTYDLYFRYDHYEIEHRCDWEYAHDEPAYRVHVDTVVEHVCHELANWPRVSSKLPRPTIEVPLPEEPPF
jgi:hypothetical protein